MKKKIVKFDEEIVSPLIKNLNYLIIGFSILGFIGLNEYLVLMPNHIIRIVSDSKGDAGF
jgi:hypothetical protein